MQQTSTLLLIFCALSATKGFSFEERDAKSGKILKQASPGVIVEAPADYDAPPLKLSKEPEYLDDGAIATSSAWPSDLTLYQPPSLAFGLGLTQRAFDSRLALSFPTHSWLKWEPWLGFFKQKNSASEFYRYAIGGDVIAHYRVAKAFDPFVSAGLGYASWQLTDDEKSASTLGQYAIGITFMFTKNFGMQLSRKTLHYLGERPRMEPEKSRVASATVATEIGFFACM